MVSTFTQPSLVSFSPLDGWTGMGKGDGEEERGERGMRERDHVIHFIVEIKM
jgi:hypothetical protein